MNRISHYQKVKSFIVKGIDAGDWPAGALLPSENQLASQFSLSRMTVNRAIKDLESDGIVERIRGKGTFVAPPKPLTSVLKIEGIDQEVLDRGSDYRREVLLLKHVSAPVEVARNLGVKKGTELQHSSIVHFENEEPIQLEQRWLIPSVAPGYLQQDFENSSPHQYLMSVAPFTHGEHKIEACMPGARIRKRLGLADNEPALLIHRRTWIGKKFATYVRLYHPGNRFQITTRISR